MGMAWEAYHKGVPLLGVTGITLDLSPIPLEQWRKIPSCLRYIGDEILPGYVRIQTNYCKDPYQTTRIQWKLRLFFSWLPWVMIAWNTWPPAREQRLQLVMPALQEATPSVRVAIFDVRPLMFCETYHLCWHMQLVDVLHHDTMF